MNCEETEEFSAKELSQSQSQGQSDSSYRPGTESSSEISEVYILCYALCIFSQKNIFPQLFSLVSTPPTTNF